MNDGDTVDLARALDVLRDRGCSVVLTEAGPTMFGSLVASRLVDELFLTVSPLLAGRAATEPVSASSRASSSIPADSGGRAASLGAGARLAPLPPLRADASCAG